jgi:hypothetical protein
MLPERLRVTRYVLAISTAVLIALFVAAYFLVR